MVKGKVEILSAQAPRHFQRETSSMSNKLGRMSNSPHRPRRLLSKVLLLFVVRLIIATFFLLFLLAQLRSLIFVVFVALSQSPYLVDERDFNSFASPILYQAPNALFVEYRTTAIISRLNGNLLESEQLVERQSYSR